MRLLYWPADRHEGAPDRRCGNADEIAYPSPLRATRREAKKLRHRVQLLRPFCRDPGKLPKRTHFLPEISGVNIWRPLSRPISQGEECISCPEISDPPA